MTEFFADLLSIGTLVFAASSMLSVGFAYTLAEIVGPLRDYRAVARALVANFVLVPALAFLVIELVQLDRPHEVGLILIGTAAGAPFVIKLSATAGANMALTTTLLVLLLPVTVLYMPLVVPWLVPGTDVEAGAIAGPLIMTMLIPLAVGLIVRALWADWARRVRPAMSTLSSIALIVLVLSTLIAYFDAIFDIGWEALVAAALLVIGAFALGYLIGGYNPDNREVLGLGTGQRNIAAASVVATQAVDNPNTISMVIVTSMVGLAILFPTARFLNRRKASRGKPR